MIKASGHVQGHFCYYFANLSSNETSRGKPRGILTIVIDFINAASSGYLP